MDYFLLAFLAPFLWAISNRIDKYLLAKHFKGEIGALFLFSCFISVVALPIIYLIQPSVIFIDPFYAIILILTGALYIAYMFPYFAALNIEDASRVIPIF